MWDLLFILLVIIAFVVYLYAPRYFYKKIRKGHHLEGSDLDAIILFSLLRYNELCTCQISTELFQRKCSEITERLQILLKKGFVKLSKEEIPFVSENTWKLNF